MLNVADEFEKCMNFKLDVLIIIEIHKMKIWKQQVAGFRYEILPESQKLLTCEYCKINNIIDAFCNNADFGLLILKLKIILSFFAKFRFF